MKLDWKRSAEHFAIQILELPVAVRREYVSETVQNQHGSQPFFKEDKVFQGISPSTEPCGTLKVTVSFVMPSSAAYIIFAALQYCPNSPD